MQHVFLFELRYRLRQVSTYLFFLILFLLAFGFVASDVVKLGGGDARVHINAPLVLGRIVTLLTALGAVMASALVGTAIYRDFECGVHELFFTTRVSKRAYFGGRFLGAFLVTLLVFSGILWGVLVGTLMPWVDQTKLQPFRAASYVQPFLLFLVPNLLLVSALFFTLGALTRSLLAIYAQGVVLLVGYLIAVNLLRDLDNRVLAGLLDPFGLTPTRLMTLYWTTAEKNTQLLPLTGYLLWNRLLWLGVSVATLAAGYRAFAFSARPLSVPRALRRPRHAPDETTAPATPLTLGVPAAPRFDPTAARQQFFALVGFFGRDIVRGVPFLVIVLMGVVLLVANALQADKAFGTTTYPVTRVMVQVVTGSFTLFFLILITFYAGELTWRERVLKLDQIHDALPVATGTTLLAKLTALVVVQAALLVVLMVTGMLVQAAKGYFRFEPDVYAAYLLGMVFPGLVLVTVLAFFIHSVVNHKFLGHTLMIVYYISLIALPALGWQHNLTLFGGTPLVQYSDMNRFGPFVAPVFWFTLYWSAFAALLLIAASLFWTRGSQVPWKQRVAQAARRWRPATTAAALAGLLVFASAGAYTFYNTNVLHTFRSDKDEQRLQAEYEKRYKARYGAIKAPRVTDVKAQMDLFPERGQYRVRGTYQLRNKTDRPVATIPVTLSDVLTIRALDWGRPARRVLADTVRGFHVYELAQPLAPGESLPLTFDIAYEKRGFPNGTPPTEAVQNGSFVSGAMPQIGYQEAAELTDEDQRKKHKLAPRPRRAPASDLAARRNAYFISDADWIGFEATISTTPDQIALAPGYLQREWIANGRRHFHYKMDAPIRNFYTFLSARYAVKRDRWTSGKQNVAIEIYHHPTHTYNLDRMIRGVQRSLDYYTKHFGPYQYRQLRIVEFPAYATFAQAFPNTVPYSEAIGFIARVNDPSKDIDYPFYVTAHEVAHQWWGHQVVGGNVEGSEMLSESLAEYSALMVMEREYGPDQMRKFLRYDLDGYLRGRGTERENEEPLLRVQNQPYIHYQKGALAFYALRDHIGEAKLNAALARFLRDKAFQEPPYTTALELMPYLKQATPPQLHYLLTDLFETITLHDNQVQSAKAIKRGPNRYQVTLTVQAKKLRADGTGKETPTPLGDAIDIGVFAKPEAGQELGKPLFLEKRTLTQPTTTLTLEVTGEPAKAGIDPYHKLIDRVPEDNVKAVEVDAQ